MTEKNIRDAANIIADVTGKGTYLHIAMKGVSDKAVHLLVYGVMEKYYTLNFIIDELCEKIKNNLRPYMLVALYCVLYTDKPAGIVTGIVCEALTKAGKGAVKGFFTAVIAKADRADYSLPAPGQKGYEETKYNLPSWLIGMYKKEYPNKYGEIIERSEKHFTHIVPYCEEWEVFSADPNAEKTKTGYFVKNDKEIGKLFADGKVTYMSLGSTMICESVGEVNGKKILDACAAPGGKAVYLAKKGGEVIACDIHPHRMKLIESYAKRMRTKMTVLLQDAMQLKEDFIDSFDVVLCDVPCSGLGVIDKKRDIVINKKYEDILALSEAQKKILNNCSLYVKPGGTLIYSTCTVFSIENGQQTEAFLQAHSDYIKEDEVQYLPDGKGMEGFYLCRMRKN